jgi:hypothetical protein
MNWLLMILTASLPFWTKLSSIRLEARPEFDHAHPKLPNRSYLEDLAVASLLSNSLRHALTTLVLDTGGSAFVPRFQRVDDLHICPLIAAHLPNLRRLKLRMRKICPDVFTSGDCECFANLQSIVINLNLRGVDPNVTARHSQHCASGRTGWDLHEDMVNAAKEAIPLMPKIKMLRVLCYDYSSLMLVAVSCRSGRRTNVSENMWEEEEEEEEVEEESEHDDSEPAEDSNKSSSGDKSSSEGS